MFNRYLAKRTCHTEPVITGSLLPCGPALLGSLTAASTQPAPRTLRTRRARKLVSFFHLKAPDCSLFQFIPFLYLRFDSLKSHSSFHPFLTAVHVCAGKRRYSHEFLLQMRFSPAACIRPLDLELIPGVTDNIPGTKITIIYRCLSCCMSRFSCHIPNELLWFWNCKPN